MTTTVIDSNNLEAVLADAQSDPNAPASKAEAKPEQKVAYGEKKSEESDKKTEADADDIEDDDGLTPAQKRELSAKMLKAIGKKHREKKEAEEFAAAQYNERKLAERRAEEAERKLTESQPKAEEKKPDTERPNRQNFETDDAYIEALAGWKASQLRAEEKAAEAKAAAERRQQEIIETAKARLAKAAELVPDFEEVVNGSPIQVPNLVAGYMQKSEMFAELGYHFAKNPDVLVSLSKLEPADQLVTVGKIEGRLKPFAAKADETKDETKDGDKPSDAPNTKKSLVSDETGFSPSSKARSAAPVIKPLGSEGTAVETDVKDMDIREHINHWSKTNKANLSLRRRH